MSVYCVSVSVCTYALATHRGRDERASPNRPHTTARNHSKPSVNTHGDERRGRGRVGLSEQQRGRKDKGMGGWRGRGDNVGGRERSGGPRVSQQDVSAIVK